MQLIKICLVFILPQSIFCKLQKSPYSVYDKAAVAMDAQECADIAMWVILNTIN